MGAHSLFVLFYAFLFEVTLISNGLGVSVLSIHFNCRQLVLSDTKTS